MFLSAPQISLDENKENMIVRLKAIGERLVKIYTSKNNIPCEVELSAHRHPSEQEQLSVRLDLAEHSSFKLYARAFDHNGRGSECSEMPGTHEVSSLSEVLVSGNGEGNNSVTISVTFEKSVIVDTTLGRPRIPITVGANKRYAYFRRIVEQKMFFTYHLLASDNRNAQIIVAEAIDPNQGIISHADSSSTYLYLGNVSPFSWPILDTTEPISRGLTIESGNYLTGSMLYILLEFDEDIVVDTSLGTPRIPITIGMNARFATYDQVIGDNSARFSYEILASDIDDNGIGFGSEVGLEGGSISDMHGNTSSVVAVIDPGNLGSIFINVPYVISVEVPQSIVDFLGELIINVVFDKTVNVNAGNGTPQLPLQIGTVSKNAQYKSGDNSTTLAFGFTVEGSDIGPVAIGESLLLDGGVIQDSSGNDAYIKLPENTILKNIRIKSPFVRYLQKVSAGPSPRLGSSYFNCLTTTAGNVNCGGYVNVPAIANILEISSLDGHACVLNNSGNVLCWGDGTSGKLGHGESTNHASSPVTVVSGSAVSPPPLSNIVQVSAGVEHTCALSNSKEVYCWGGNSSGQLGDGTNINKHYAVAVVGVDGVGTLANIVQVGAGENFTCALSDSGVVYCWGSKLYFTGQASSLQPREIRDPSRPDFRVPRIVQISVGGDHACALTYKNRVICWGASQDFNGSQLGRGANSSSFIRKLDYVVDGDASTNPLGGIVQVAAGGNHTCALNESGSVLCWGDRSYNILGDGFNGGSRNYPDTVSTSSVSDVIQIDAGYTRTCALKLSGEVTCWGERFNWCSSIR